MGLLVIVQGIPEFVSRYKELNQPAGKGKATVLQLRSGEIKLQKPLKRCRLVVFLVPLILPFCWSCLDTCHHVVHQFSLKCILGRRSSRLRKPAPTSLVFSYSSSHTSSKLLLPAETELCWLVIQARVI